MSMIVGQQFETMYQTLRDWNVLGKPWKRKFIPMSAGVNWAAPNPAVVELLTAELSLNMTTRNYGHAGGLPPVSRLLEFVERRLHRTPGLAATIVHGTTEGAHLAMQYLRDNGATAQGDQALMIGHGFPLYSRLCAEFGLGFQECLGNPAHPQSQLPSRDEVATALAAHQPSVVFVILPNNPLGEIIGPELLDDIGKYAAANGTHLIVDRVCLMPWDDCSALFRVLGPLIAGGQAIAVDSLSKSESLAGLRCGYLVSDAATKVAIVELIKSRYLNPVVFPTATLALTRLAQTAGRALPRIATIYEDAYDYMLSEYPSDEAHSDFFQRARTLLPVFEAGMRKRRDQLQRNFTLLQAAFKDNLAQPLRFDAGFNVALAIQGMHAGHEVPDHYALLREHGVGILSSRCFCQAPPQGRYFVRIGLTLPEHDFAEGLARMVLYYDG